MSPIAQSAPFHHVNAQTPTAQHRALRIWLFAIAALIFAMVIVGGATRLTDSGLSITEWQPILGVIPPLNEADWQAALEKYRQIPQYQLINKGMSLAEFKAIYWWEWAHRFLGRFIGVAFFVPFMIFLASGAIPRPLLPKLVGIFLLGGAQGALGWYMVMSGLTERTDVSQYRLAAHLGLAVLIYAAVLWVAFGLGRRADGNSDRQAPSSLKVAVAGLAVLIFLQILLGGFVAGTNAGLSHNTWPLMDGALIPKGLGAMEPWYLNAFENVLTIQFNHRMLAYAIAVLAAINVALALRSGAPAAGSAAIAVFAIVLVQIVLGILALLSHLQIGLALAHQAGGIVLLGVVLHQLHGLTAGQVAHDDLQRAPAGA
ncbi:MAG: COX15/CtaA family protein [Rhodomicrobiaceae bacterium]